MALAEVIKTGCANIAIWHKTETVEELKEILEDNDIFNKIKTSYSNTKRQTEQLISHILIKHLLGQVKEIKHRSNGAPYIENCENKFISISHSKKSIAVAISEKPIGIDLEEIDRKQYSLHKKFTTTNEQLWIESSDNKQLISAIIWSAKEAIYKLANIEKLLFESEIEIAPFNPTKESNFIATYRGKVVNCQFSSGSCQLLVVSC
ncbi:MAG: 4'-phosphopantetheinyl transferase superfamily protein [Bacteroidales bacterium]|nr:4'-phosphopantetheinyl transferase superfamily protein [Bacteroidales bacterium]